jgi:hypothetical protein
MKIELMNRKKNGCIIIITIPEVRGKLNLSLLRIHKYKKNSFDTECKKIAVLILKTSTTTKLGADML